MKCYTCGEKYSQPSLGGANICPRCDCGYKPNGEKFTYKEIEKVAIRYRKGLIPYFEQQSSESTTGEKHE